MSDKRCKGSEKYGSLGGMDVQK